MATDNREATCAEMLTPVACGAAVDLVARRSVSLSIALIKMLQSSRNSDTCLKNSFT
jgi:hypothetical protein